MQSLPTVWRAQPMGDAHTYDALTNRAVVEPRSGTVDYMVDGDLIIHKGPLTLETGPLVRILVEHKQGFRPMSGMSGLFA